MGALCVAPTYFHQAAKLLLAGLQALSATDAERVRLCTASCENEKASLARSVGFCYEVTLEGQLQAGLARCDLDILVWSG